MNRPDQRQALSLRKIVITPDVMPHAEGSVEIKWGSTKVLCSASVEEKLPKWREKRGWLTAQYNMLPRAARTRLIREKTITSGRTKEISRLIGRSLRASCRLELLGERQIHIDCDVVQADGGTRAAAVTGGFCALALALEKLLKENKIKENPLLFYTAALSVALLGDNLILDPCESEDKNCSVDMTIVCSHTGGLIEVQGTAEQSPFTPSRLNEIIKQAQKASEHLFETQSQVMGRFFPLKKT